MTLEDCLRIRVSYNGRLVDLLSMDVFGGDNALAPNYREANDETLEKWHANVRDTMELFYQKFLHILYDSSMSADKESLFDGDLEKQCSRDWSVKDDTVSIHI